MYQFCLPLGCRAADTAVLPTMGKYHWHSSSREFHYVHVRTVRLRLAYYNSFVSYYRFSTEHRCGYEYASYVSLQYVFPAMTSGSSLFNVDQPSVYLFNTNGTSCPSSTEVRTLWKSEYCPYHTRPVSNFLIRLLNVSTLSLSV